MSKDKNLLLSTRGSNAQSAYELCDPSQILPRLHKVLSEAVENRRYLTKAAPMKAS